MMSKKREVVRIFISNSCSGNKKYVSVMFNAPGVSHSYPCDLDCEGEIQSKIKDCERWLISHGYVPKVLDLRKPTPKQNSSD